MAIHAFMMLLAASGCTVPGAAGIVANFEPESGFSPTIDHGLGLGLAQLVGNRKKRMLVTLGVHWSDWRWQTGYILREMWDMGIYESICHAQEAGRAAAIMMVRYEMPDNANTGPRAARARQISAAYGR